MTHVLSRSRSAQFGAVALAGGLLLAGCSSKAATATASTGGTGATTTTSAASNCPALGTTPTFAKGTGSVNVYSVDGLMDTTDQNNWYNKEFAAFTAATGIKVNYTELGSGPIEAKVESEKANPQADVLVTLPPFIQKAEAAGVLQAYSPQCVDKVDPSDVDKNGEWEAVMGDYLSFIYNSKQVTTAPVTWNDLLDPQYKGKLQYSTPGVAGDGTAVMIQAIHDFGSESAAMAYFKSLQPSNVGPSSSTGKLETKVNTGNILVANGDIQMNYVDGKNSYPNNKIFFMAPNGSTTPDTFSLPYMGSLVKGGPNTANGKELLDFLLSQQAQEDTSAIAYGFPARTDVVPTDANYTALKQAMSGVTVFPVDWASVEQNYAQYVSDWDTATGTPAS
jgi:2-aminoethylphosphonate transport system substrate-binding protein